LDVRPRRRTPVVISDEAGRPLDTVPLAEVLPDALKK
jgi:hypothetical protein